MVTPEGALKWDEENVARQLEDKLGSVGMKTIQIETKKTAYKTTEALTKIEPLQKKKIDQVFSSSLTLKIWSTASEVC